MPKEENKLPLEPTVNTKHLYSDHEVQDVIKAYTKDLPTSNLNSAMKLEDDRMKEVGSNSLLLLPKDIKNFNNLYEQQGFYYTETGIDNLTPRLNDFIQITQSEELKNNNKKIDFLVPILENGHWKGAIITYDSQKEIENQKYSYTFLDSFNHGAGVTKEDFQQDKLISSGVEEGRANQITGEMKKNEVSFDLKSRNTNNKAIANVITSVFKQKNIDITSNINTKGFYGQPDPSLGIDSKSCGACLVNNFMMNTGVIKAENKYGVDQELRKEHFDLVPSIRHNEAIADALYTIDNKELTKQVTNVLNSNQLIEAKANSIGALSAAHQEDKLNFIQSLLDEVGTEKPLNMDAISTRLEALNQKANSQKKESIELTDEQLARQLQQEELSKENQRKEKLEKQELKDQTLAKEIYNKELDQQIKSLENDIASLESNINQGNKLIGSSQNSQKIKNPEPNKQPEKKQDEPKKDSIWQKIGKAISNFASKIWDNISSKLSSKKEEVVVIKIPSSSNSKENQFKKKSAQKLKENAKSASKNQGIPPFIKEAVKSEGAKMNGDLVRHSRQTEAKSSAQRPANNLPRNATTNIKKAGAKKGGEMRL